MTTQPPKSWERPAGHLKHVVENSWYSTIFQLYATIFETTGAHWKERGVLPAMLPITTNSISSPMGAGSDSSPVSVELNGRDVYLADSMQFGLELACRLSSRGAYYVMPSFRGETPDHLHLSEFTHSECEVPGNLDLVMMEVEAYVRRLSESLLQEHGPALRRLAGTTEHIERLAVARSFEQMSFDEVAARLPDSVGDLSNGARCLSKAGEQEIIRTCGPFTWIREMDHLACPFYQAFADRSMRKAVNADLLFGPGEVVGAGQRHDTADAVQKALKLHAVRETGYSWYLQMRTMRRMTTSGFGMGVERFLMWVLCHDDIRDVPLLIRPIEGDYGP